MVSIEAQEKTVYQFRVSEPLFIAVLRIRDVYPESRIPDPDFFPSRIPDLGSRILDLTIKRGGKNFISCLTFFVASRCFITQNCCTFLIYKLFFIFKQRVCVYACMHPWGKVRGQSCRLRSTPRDSTRSTTFYNLHGTTWRWK